MVVFPNCKINLGLNVLRKRDDGYHDIETVFYPISFNDGLEVIHSNTLQENVQYSIPIAIGTNVQFSMSGSTVEGKTGDNLCVKAYQLLKKDFPHLPLVKMHLHKSIPLGAGLGGGSADGAFALRLLNQKFELGLTEYRLLQYALALGSDCPFFIINETCFATGRGEILDPIVLDLSTFKFAIVNPGVPIGTAEIFSSISPVIPLKSIKNIISQPVQTWKKELKNDLEVPVFEQCPEIRVIKEKLYEAGAVYASMTGSGSTVYGLFEKNTKLEFSFPPHYLIKELAGQLQ
jgi:4-diphosphocytidyl-2-C-methyl-D-erythritol kinase